MTYPQALEYLASLAPRGWRLGLDRMQELVKRADLADAVGGPNRPAFIHIAGTNGKGSTTAFVQSLLVEGGYRTGAFYSPFVYDPRERVQFGRGMISEADFSELTGELLPIGESLSETEFGGVTEFEFKTALGFLYWKRKKCEWVALEVGLGGRLDATNVVMPRVSVIVSIGLDHTSILGDTLAAIAHEKAGIIKPGVPVILGQVPPEAEEVLRSEARNLCAPVWQFGRDIGVEKRGEELDVWTPNGRFPGPTLGIEGAMQPHNMALAVAACQAAGVELGAAAIERGITWARAPGRFQLLQLGDRTVVLDGAHNADAAAVLASSLRGRFGEDVKVVMVTGMVAGHEPQTFYEPLKDTISSAHVAPIAFHRAVDTRQLADALGSMVAKVLIHPELGSAIDAATDEAGPGGVVLVTGSFYLVGEAGKLLGL